ncbi:MAG TPA: aldo/keto reductase [Ktedonobacteraceae bacterium]|nr:aldo/keto reductase [Ktedonobacteraceae bacterium]
MHTRRLGNTDIEITPIGLGTWAIGGNSWLNGWGAQDDQESIATIKRALNLGINWIDTAAIYGQGHSEEIVGKAIKGRDKPLIFTKCTRLWDEQGKITGSLKADSILREAEASLKRLDIDVIDLYQIHWPDPEADIEEGWSAMAQLKKEGKVRAIGVSNFNVEQLQRAMRIAPVDSLQPPYSLVNSAVDKEILPFCQEHNIGVIVYSPMASGLLTGAMTKERAQNLPDDDWRKKNPEFNEPRLSRNLELATLLADIGFPYNRTPGEVAIAWTLGNPAVTGAIVGGRHPRQVEELIGAAEFRLDELAIKQIDKFLSEHP